MGEEITFDDIAELEYTDNPSEMVQGSNESVDSGQIGHKSIYEALAAFQAECPTIPKDTKGHNYYYAGLPKIVEVVRPIMAAHNLGFTQTFDYLHDGISLVTTLFHTTTGETITSEMKMPVLSDPRQNVYQSLGSGVSYIRRYMLSAILGLVTDDDDDAVSAPQPEKQQPKQNYPTVQIADEYPTQAIRR
jgi:hypothetical protein